MKQQKWINDNKMKFESLHKTFNKKTNCISTGACCYATQYSRHIRCYDEIECNGLHFEKGHLMNADLNMFLNLPNLVKIKVIEKSKELKQTIILYRFGFYIKNQFKTIGYVLTDSDYNFIDEFYDYKVKDSSVIEECKKYICK